MSLKLLVPEHSSKRPRPIIAIDGPAGGGKSTGARWLAYKLGFKLIDTGALYRSLAFHALERNVSLDDEAGLATLCKSLRFSFGELEKPGDAAEDSGIPKLQVFCDGIDLSESIRTPEIGRMTSNISKFPAIRSALLNVQRDFGVEGGIVMEGRDIGTVIFPDAEIKFYLTASIERRAQRRCEELKAAGVSIDLEVVRRETQARDEQDMNREFAPLKKADDAILIDSTTRSLDEVVSEMAGIVRAYLKK